jgi:hypothetical protein
MAEGAINNRIAPSFHVYKLFRSSRQSVFYCPKSENYQLDNAFFADFDPILHVAPTEIC